jgi:hypothetical protein
MTLFPFRTQGSERGTGHPGGPFSGVTAPVGARGLLENDKGATYSPDDSKVNRKEVTPYTMRGPSSDAPTLSPSPLLALVAASVVHSFSPSWLARPVSSLAEELHLRADRVSRLKRILLRLFESLLDRALERGRPRREKPSDESLHIRSLEALLGVASDVFKSVSIRKRSLQDRLVTGCDRLEKEHDLSRRDFARALGLKERTLRYWAKRLKRSPDPNTRPALAPPIPAKKKVAPSDRVGRLGRFALDVTLPGIQGIADTTDWELFQVPLKIVAQQDPGARRERLWEGFEVDDHEDHEVILKVVRETAEEKPGLQLLTDQGTPYVCEALRQACEEMEIEQAPQKEATPTEKATLERSFRTVKEALSPLVRLTGKLSEVVPHLRSADLAKAAGKLLLATFLRVYTLGRRQSVTEHLAADPVVLEALAEAQRERARAENRSVKLKLEEIHAAYNFPDSVQRFVRAHRRHRLEDIEEAVHAMGVRACRCHAKCCDRYFAAILRNVAEKNAQWRLKLRRQRLADHQSQIDRERAEIERKRREAAPENAIADALDLLARQYQADRGDLLFGGMGPGRGRLATALGELKTSDDGAAADRAEVGWKLWEARNAGQPGGRTESVRAVFDQEVAAILAGEKRSTPQLANDILGLKRSHENRRPPPR